MIHFRIDINVEPYTRPVRTVQWEGRKYLFSLYPIEIKSEHVRKRGKIITGIISQTSSIACWVYVQDRKKRLQDVSDDGAIYMLPSVYSCIGITYNKTLLEAHGWELPKSFVDLETWQRKQKRRGYSCALHRLNIRKNRSKICVDLKKNY